MAISSHNTYKKNIGLYHLSLYKPSPDKISKHN